MYKILILVAFFSSFAFGKDLVFHSGVSIPQKKLQWQSLISKKIMNSPQTFIGHKSNKSLIGMYAFNPYTKSQYKTAWCDAFKGKKINSKTCLIQTKLKDKKISYQIRFLTKPKNKQQIENVLLFTFPDEEENKKDFLTLVELVAKR